MLITHCLGSASANEETKVLEGNALYEDPYWLKILTIAIPLTAHKWTIAKPIGIYLVSVYLLSIVRTNFSEFSGNLQNYSC